MRVKQKAFKLLLRIFWANVIAAIVLTGSCNLVLNSSEKIFNKSIALKPFDAIIVPGVPFEDKEWSDVMKIRVYWSFYLWKEGITRNVIYSGSAVYTPYRESEIMAAYARALGMPDNIIYLESQAEHSTENLFYGHRLGQRLGFQKIALATDPFQNSMLKSFRKRHFKNVVSLPIQFDVLDSMEMINPSIDHEALRLTEFTSIKEREGFFKRLRGTMGKNVIDSIRN